MFNENGNLRRFLGAIVLEVGVIVLSSGIFTLFLGAIVEFVGMIALPSLNLPIVKASLIKFSLYC
ncbi:MAG: hypothetical protein C4288_09225 [Leptolyngbya sp. ERB_1_1]